MRVLCLDYGEKRIGVAVCDELGMSAHGLSTIVRKTKMHDEKILASIIENYKIEKILIGYPLRLDGSEGIQCQKVNRFANLLAKTFLLPVIKWPETLSTREAEEILIHSGMKWQKRKNNIDRLAACLILQDYLNHLNKAH